MNKRLALVIGNNEYRDRRLAVLKSPEADVMALAEVLQAPDIGGFSEVRSLLNDRAATVRKEIARFLSADRDRNDLLLLYFSGHGVKNVRGELYLAVSDTETDLLSATAIPASFISEEMDATASRRLVLVLDCCHSGAFLRGAKGASGVSVDTAGAFAGSGSGRVILTATDSTQYAWEGAQVTGKAQASMFTRFMVEGLRTGAADLDFDGDITIDELYEYVHRQVVDHTPNQHPRKFALNQEGELVIARSPGPVELPRELISAVKSPFPGARLDAVVELAGEGWLRSLRPGRVQAAVRVLTDLAGDDSRRVAEAARASLEAHPPTFKPEPPRLESTLPPSELARPPHHDAVQVLAWRWLRHRARSILATPRPRLVGAALLPVFALPLLAPLRVTARKDLYGLVPFLVPLAAGLVGAAFLVAGSRWERRIALALAAACLAVGPSAYAYLAHAPAAGGNGVTLPTPPPTTITTTSSPVATSKVPAEFIGTWRGIGHPTDPKRSDFAVVVTLTSGEVGSIVGTYSDGLCGHGVLLAAATNESVTMDLNCSGAYRVTMVLKGVNRSELKLSDYHPTVLANATMVKSE